MSDVIDSDHRNSGMEVSVHYGPGLDSSVLVYDLQIVSATNSMADVFRVFLQFAEKMQKKSFSEVRLCYRGEHKFTLGGYDFRTLGHEYETQNPAYTMRTFPEKLKTPSGGRAYAEWSGGLLGVLGKQLEDFNDFHKKWYVDDMGH